MSKSGLEHRSEHDPRAAALIVINQVLSTNVDSQMALDKRLTQSKLIPSDKNLCTELVYGVLRRHLRLEWYLRQKLEKPEKLPTEMFLSLELALYQLAHTRIPAHAAIDCAVSLVKNRFGQGLSKVANGVLRASARALETEYQSPSWIGSKIKASEDSLEVLSILYAVPLWIVTLWVNSYGRDSAIKMLEASSNAAPLGVRVNLESEGSAVIKKELLERKFAKPIGPAGVVLPEGAGKNMRPFEVAGQVTRQSMAAYEALWSMNPAAWAHPIWDACAGRGNKSMALLEQNITVEMASDSNSNRLNALLPDFERLKLKLDAPKTMQVEAQKSGFKDEFDTILLDVPCSGLGTLSHRPEIRWRRSEADLKDLLPLQDEILAAALAAVKTGGRIVYMTCTANPDENQKKIHAFIEQNSSIKIKIEQEFETEASMPYGEFFYAASLIVDK